MTMPCVTVREPICRHIFEPSNWIAFALGFKSKIKPKDVGKFDLAPRWENVWKKNGYSRTEFVSGKTKQIACRIGSTGEVEHQVGVGLYMLQEELSSK